MKPKGTVTLDRALSKLGIASRKKALELILQKRVHVNGKLTINPNQNVVPEKIKITIDNTEVTLAPKVLIALNKPKGYVTTTEDEKNRKTVFELLPNNFGKLITVGRLDMATTGLLLITTDTRLANSLTDPENKVPRSYVVTIDGHFQQIHAEKCLQGIMDKGECLQSSQIVILKTSQKESQIKMTLLQGKNREIRRLMNCLNFEVTKLKRISFGPYELGDLEVGQWKELVYPTAANCFR